MSRLFKTLNACMIQWALSNDRRERSSREEKLGERIEKLESKYWPIPRKTSIQYHKEPGKKGGKPRRKNTNS